MPSCLRPNYVKRTLPRATTTGGARCCVLLICPSYAIYRASVGAARQKHTLPELPYEYSALEPVISREIMSLHHSKHHATYINNLNAAEEKLAKAQANGR